MDTAGIVVGCLAAVAVAGLLVWGYFWLQANKRSSEWPMEQDMLHAESNVRQSGTIESGLINPFGNSSSQGVGGGESGQSSSHHSHLTPSPMEPVRVSFTHSGFKNLRALSSAASQSLDLNEVARCGPVIKLDQFVPAAAMLKLSVAIMDMQLQS